MTQQLTTTFDYSQLDDGVQLKLLEQEEQLDIVLKRTRKDIGLILLEVRTFLTPSQMYAWCASKGMSKTTAWRAMQEAQGKALPSPKQDTLMDVFQNETQQYDEPEDDIDRQEVQGILGEYGLPMQDEDDTPLPDSTDIDVPALYAENQQLKAKCQQLESEKATLEGQLQEALRQGASIDATTPTRHYGGGGGHHKPPISEKDGVTRTMVNFDHWETTKIRLDPGWNFEDFGMGTIDMQGGTYEIFVCDKKKQCVVPVKPHDIPSVRQELQKLDQGLEKRYAAWKASQK